MERNITELIQQISELPPKWHGAGSVDVDELLAIARYAEAIGPIRHSVETGSGKSTLLFSHLSADHRAFAVDAGDSISQVRRSPLFRSEAVTYVEGGLLLVDDILIPSIRRMFEIIRADEMFELLEVVSSNMAIFRRTSAPRIDPQGDGWWLQGYNRSYFETIQRGTAAPTRLQAMYRPVLSKALHTASALAPQNLKDRIPERIKRKFWTKM